MKNFFKYCLFVFMMVGLSAIGYTDEQFPFLAQVSKTSVNVRAGGNTNFEKLDQLKQGDEVIVLAKSFDWYKVQLPPTAKSFVRADYLDVAKDSQATVLADKVHIRSAPNSDSTSLGFLHKGDQVKTVFFMNGWWQIQAPVSAYGWIRQDFLTMKSTRIHEASQIKKPLPTIEVKGKLVPSTVAHEGIYYELLVNGQTAYYVQSPTNIDQFKGAFISIRGLVDSQHKSLSYPVLRTINISLLL